MSIKSIVAKIAIGCIIISALSVAVWFLSTPENEEVNSDFTVLSRDVEKLQKIEVFSNNSFTLNLSEKGWEMEGMEEIGVNNAYASALAKSLSEIHSPMLSEENAEDISLFGLDEPTVRIVLTYEDCTETVKIGNDSGDYSYVTVDDKSVYIVPKQDLYMACSDKMTYLDTVAFSSDADSIDYVSFGDIVLIKKDDKWQEEKPYNLLTDSDKVKSEIIQPLSLIDSVDIISKNDVSLKEKIAVNVGIGESREIFYVSNGDGYSYLYFDNSKYVYKVEDSSVEFLSVKGFDLLAKYVAPILISEVSEIKFVSPKETVVLSIEAPSTEAPVFYKNGKEVTEESFRSFYQILMGLTFSSEGKGNGKADYTIEFKEESGKETKIEFVPFSNSEYLVRINGKADFLILKKSVTDVFGYIEILKEF